MDPMISRLLDNNKFPEFFTLEKLAAAGVSTNMSPYIHPIGTSQVYWMPQDIGVLQRRWVAWCVVIFCWKKVEEVALLGVSTPHFYGSFTNTPDTTRMTWNIFKTRGISTDKKPSLNPRWHPAFSGLCIPDKDKSHEKLQQQKTCWNLVLGGYLKSRISIS